MFHHYAITETGKYHKKLGNVCQDFHAYRETDCFAVGAVADGLGSELHSDIASRIACCTVVDYTVSSLEENENEEKILAVLKQAFEQALNAIEKRVEEANDDIAEYDTTLDAVIYMKGTGKLYWGHSGDAGIIALMSTGEYKDLTVKQNGEFANTLFPLCCTDKWEFGQQENVRAVLLATDGLLDNVFHNSLLLNESTNGVYVDVCEYFMNPIRGFTEDEDSMCEERFKKYILQVGEKTVNDDMTVLCISDPDVLLERMDDEYYIRPDWDLLKKKQRAHFAETAYQHSVSVSDETDTVVNLRKEGFELLKKTGEFLNDVTEVALKKATSVIDMYIKRKD